MMSNKKQGAGAGQNLWQMMSGPEEEVEDEALPPDEMEAPNRESLFDYVGSASFDSNESQLPSVPIKERGQNSEPSQQERSEQMRDTLNEKAKERQFSNFAFQEKLRNVKL